MNNKEMVSTGYTQESKGPRSKLLECLPRSSCLPNERLRWNTNEEIASYLVSFEKHDEWLSCTLKTRPRNGSIILYNRKKVKYRKDGYCWKKRKDRKHTREDHMKLKVQGMECLYGNYVHSAIVPTFHRRCYWLLQNPDIVLVHYLNVPSMEDSGKCSPLLCGATGRHDAVKWNRDDLLGQLKPMFHSIKCSGGGGDFTIEELVQLILERQRTKPQPRTYACLCNGNQGRNIPHSCTSTKHRIISPKLPPSSSSPLTLETEELGGGGGDAKLPQFQARGSPTSSPGPASTSATSPPLTTVALPHNAVIVMATTSAISAGPREDPPKESLSLARSTQLLLSPALPHHSRPHLPCPPSPTPPSLPAPVRHTLSLTLLPSPVIGGLLLAPSSAASPPLSFSSPSLPPPFLPPAFDPDSFLNSPKQGQTYGGPLPPIIRTSSPVSPSSLALSPTSTPPSSVSPPSSLSSSSCEPDRKDAASLPPSFLLSPTSLAAPPLCLELGAVEVPPEVVGVDREENERGGDVAGSALPTKHHQDENCGSAEDPSRSATPRSGTASREQPDGRPEDVTMQSAARPPPAPRAKRVNGPSLGADTPPMDTEQEAEDLEISFDSQFPDLISDLITAEATPAATAPPCAPAEVAPNPAVFSAGIRYVVPPQPSPSTSFLPFPQPLPSSSPLASITDFSPEWSYPEGGVKVLITGPWSEPSGRYSCVFDQSAVPASLIQHGVLRCYCPAHQAGLVCLQVVESGGSVSSSVLFEYRARNASSLPSSQLDWLSLDDNQFRVSILERLEQMERRMAAMAARDIAQQQQPRQQHAGSRMAASVPHHPPQTPEDRDQSSQWFERRIVRVCERMMRGVRWSGGDDERLQHSARHRGMTLLHLAAAQGYSHLIHTLKTWRRVHSDSLDVEQEVDPLNVDHFSCTPLMWACALGHRRAAELLYGWSGVALGIPDSLGRLPLAVARSRGHTCLAAAVEELHTHAVASPPSTSPDTGVSSSSSLAPSPSQSSAAPMDTSPSPSSPSSSSSSSLPVEGPRAALNLLECPSEGPGRPRRPPALAEQLLGDGDDMENEGDEEEEVDMATLAKQIIEGTPERIKREDFPGEAGSPLRERRDVQDTWLATYLDTVDTPTEAPSWRVRPPSPLSALALQRLRPPSSAAWAEFLNASANGRMERDFALLTLTDGEQRELYEAARIIQNAFRRYKGRRLKEQQDMAAAVIQRCYRKYKQYALYKKMTQAAILIQSKFRSYYEQKRFQQSRRAAVLIQQYYRSYKEYERLKQSPGSCGAGHNPKIKGTFLTKKQDQAARKIMRFLRRCRHRIKELKQNRELERRGLTT
ncbi:calmodulin-binding transcription activator 2 isoform X2 [Syngnathoides biaculeatus]|uniref:calmodulin-binding transcription activator 2 isoform X2 n=1 Tax=Syngnathoides biaculeatus TaxID=300417 RepID=UPI002ADDE683|nr:calmodulin-binding transcription activator 2 isoform X2 [Syngnathoides biaculeatus]XP_061664276.1 calmodulin-binding transcription activator 2 isoform X2 [Syngnathoides biaculeatus]XP_061664277.1 calmodulin-binding transcription activator 2 isoform X2 [Syngnathoides biaculeatus]XP_061664278.1 calmodulin-binding transcription activator 2 isoform X2 [Syngnathoides biaculeatus]